MLNFLVLVHWREYDGFSRYSVSAPDDETAVKIVEAAYPEDECLAAEAFPADYLRGVAADLDAANDLPSNALDLRMECHDETALSFIADLPESLVGRRVRLTAQFGDDDDVLSIPAGAEITIASWTARSEMYGTTTPSGVPIMIPLNEIETAELLPLEETDASQTA